MTELLARDVRGSVAASLLTRMRTLACNPDRDVHNV